MWQQTGLALSALLASAAASPNYGAPPPAPCPPPEPEMSICDKYTTALLKDNTAANQETVLTLVVNTAIIGNYTKAPGSMVRVPGLLAPGEGEFEGVNLLPYFTGALKSSNFDNKTGVSFNFLTGGGADALKQNKPANDTTSGQYQLLTHLYSYFGALLGCSEFSNTTKPYAGRTSMYDVHKSMALDEKEVGWFITNVGLSAASFGVSDADVKTVGTALQTTFGQRCLPPASVPGNAFPSLQSICIEKTCPKARPHKCNAYEPVVEPQAA